MSKLYTIGHEYEVEHVDMINLRSHDVDNEGSVIVLTPKERRILAAKAFAAGYDTRALTAETAATAVENFLKENGL